jgi:hypothetical protein
MRSLSVFSKYFLVAALVPLASCAVAPPERTEPFTRVLEGEIAITGDVPFERGILLTTDEGMSWLIDSPSLSGELLNLDGHRVRVWGTAKPRGTSPGTFHVERYEMLPEGGLVPVIGVIGTGGMGVTLSTGDGDHLFVLIGPLSEALGHFPGYKVWIVGSTGDDGGPGGGMSIEVYGYGILGPAPAGFPTGSAPPDTLRNSHNR